VTPPAADNNYPPEFLDALRAVTNKRARVVIEHILQYGSITTEDLKETYGYNHPPRAIADVRDEGIPLERFRVKNAQGRSIAAYGFGDVSTFRAGFAGGRRQVPKRLKTDLLNANGSRCSVCGEQFNATLLQVDHRVPYRVAGDADTNRPAEWMLLCPSCNRAKSWSCEHCRNWLELRDSAHCRSCYWGDPRAYTHIALRAIRRLDVVWTEQEVADYERLRQEAERSAEPMPDFVKAVLNRHLNSTEAQAE
jgi:hypothetical protein